MRSPDRLGGAGALLAASTFIIGLAMYATLLLDDTTADTPNEAVEFLLDNQLELRIWNMVVTVVFALAMVPLVLALHDRLRATTVWAALDAAQRWLGGGNELVGGVWVLAVSATSWRGGEFRRGVDALGMAIGTCGLLTIVPPLEPLGAVFGLGLIVWYSIIGIDLLRAGSTRAAGPHAVARRDLPTFAADATRSTPTTEASGAPPA